MDSKSLHRWGSHFIIGLEGTSLTPSERSALKQVRPLGIILFAHNFEKESRTWQDSLAKLIAEVKEITENDRVMFSIDHEGGRVHRFPPPVTKFPAACFWGDDASSVSEAMARELRCLGFSMSFLPVLDILSEPTNKVIGDRAFSSDPKEVSRRGIEVFKAQEKAGIVSCGKHFPGHGATIADSHFELPILPSSINELRERELIPFIDTIEAKIPMIMTSHILFPSIDSSYPATTSKAILRDLLRNELGFSKVIVSDDMEMKALKELSLAERAELAFNAGVDVILVGNAHGESPLQKALSMIEALEGKRKSGSVTSAAIEESKSRISALASYQDRIQKESGLPEGDIIGGESHQLLCKKIAERKNKLATS